MSNAFGVFSGLAEIRAPEIHFSLRCLFLSDNISAERGFGSLCERVHLDLCAMETLKQRNECVCLTGSPTPTKHHKMGNWFFVPLLKIAA